MVNYIVEELPIMLTGIEYNGIHYKTLLYPTAASKATSGSCMANDVFYLSREIQTCLDFEETKKELIEIGQIEATEGVTLLPINEIEENVENVQDTNVVTTPAIESFKVLTRTTSRQG